MKRLPLLLVMCLILPLFASAGPVAEYEIANHTHDAARVSDDENVSFNKSSLKYHCRTCTWAKKCTENCVTVTRAEAIKRGGVACKVCGGTCR